MIEKANKKHKQPEKNLTFVSGEDLVVENFVDCKNVEIRLDGATRVVSIGSKRMLIMTERGKVYVMDLIFD